MMTPYYAEKLEEGLIFQDVVTRELYRRGIVIVGYSSRRFQNNEGENMLGAEIKRDGNFRSTGNLFIEYQEKTKPSNPAYVPSGILRTDNSWLYVIGDENTLYIFAKNWLQKICTARNYKQVESGTRTSWGYLMPILDAEKYCIRRIDIP